MAAWVDRLGLKRYIETLQVIHVTGTNGKGSTCAYSCSLLKAHSDRMGFPKKIGMYTSPHLKDETERIQINCRPITRELFAKHAWDVIDGLSIGTDPKGPRFLQAMVLIALQVFRAEGVDVAIIETHTGARYCATNFFERPVAVGITQISLDHVPELGRTVQQIAWHKAGAFKCEVPAFSTSRDPSARAVLSEEAERIGAPLEFVDKIQHLQVLHGDAQRENVQLAIRLSTALLQPYDQALTREDISSGVASVNWPGRFHVLEQGNVMWYLDGAHNLSSISGVVDWFRQKTSQSHLGAACLIIVFAQLSPRHGPQAIADRLAESLANNRITPDLVVVTNNEISTNLSESLGTIESQVELFQKRLKGTKVETEISMHSAFALAEKYGQGQKTHVLVTGSLYLVGQALSFLNA